MAPQLSAILIASLLALAHSAASLALPIYNVQRPPPPITTAGTAAVSGSIETDGTIGTLTAGNIIGVNLTITVDTVHVATLTPATTSVLVVGPGVTADATHLYFDFTAASTLLLQHTTTPTFWCLDGVSNYCGKGTYAESVRAGVSTIRWTAGRDLLPQPHIIATVPEPGTLALLGLGLASIGLALRRIR